MPLPLADVHHLMRRAAFGVSNAEAAELAALDRDALIEQVLDTSAVDLSERPAFLDDTSKQTWELLAMLRIWWLEKMRTTAAPLAEKMAFFWHGHFVAGTEKVYHANAIYELNRVFRVNGLGSFRDMAQQMAISRAMLEYLDNHSNTKDDRNENFARELMELFLLGVDQYTQDDVVSVARAWTGHGLPDRWWEGDENPLRYEFHPDRHDNGADKTIFGITKNWDGPDVIDEICVGAKKSVMARFIAAKVWSYFAYPAPAPAIVDALAQVFMDSGLDIKALMRAVFQRDEFWSDTARNGLVRTPTEFVVAALRATNIAPDAVGAQWAMSDMGQELFNPPNVSGWRQNAYWVSSTMFFARASFARNLGWRGSDADVLAGTGDKAVPDAVQAAFDLFSLDTATPTIRTAFEDYVTKERAADRWPEQVNLLTAAVLTPEFQLA